jgi:hypothetical protein
MLLPLPSAIADAQALFKLQFSSSLHAGQVMTVFYLPK